MRSIRVTSCVPKGAGCCVGSFTLSGLGEEGKNSAVIRLAGESRLGVDPSLPVGLVLENPRNVP